MEDLNRNPDLLADAALRSQVFSEIDIAECAVMVEGLPKKLAKEQVEKGLLEEVCSVMEKDGIVNPEQYIVKVEALTNLHECEKLY